MDPDWHGASAAAWADQVSGRRSSRGSAGQPVWPADLKPPTARSVGFLHQGSQWSQPPRYEQIVSIIKEGCLPAYRAGLEGLSIHGEVSSMHVPWALNYLAFSHFIHWPETACVSSGGRRSARFWMAKIRGKPSSNYWLIGTLARSQRRRSGTLSSAANRCAARVAAGEHLARWRFWNWLAHVTVAPGERHTVSIF